MAKGRKRPAADLDETPAVAASSSSSTKAAASRSIASGDGDVPSSSYPSSAAAGNTTPSGNGNDVRFGKHLASSDKRVRDRTVSALREWLQQRSRGGALTDLDLLKIWRGLWYCMFMCDKAPIQRELAQNLSGLLNLFRDDREEGVRFFRSFCITMQRDWERIDNLRIDKYYTLVRFFVREALSFCRRRPAPTQTVTAHADAANTPTKHKNKKKKKSSLPATAEAAAAPGGDSAAVWDLGLVESMAAVVEQEVIVLSPAPIGLRLHMADVWVDEACVAGGHDMPTEVLLATLAPWLRAAAAPETNAVVFKRTFEGVFEGLLRCFPVEGKEKEIEEGGVFKNVELARVQACLFEVAAAPQTREKRRTQLYKLHREYQRRTGVAPDASAPPSGILPPPPADSESSDDEDDGSEYVTAGERPRAERGSEPAVSGWVAAGIAAGEISVDGVAARPEKKSKRRRSGSLEGEEAVPGGDEGVAEKEEEKPRKKRKRDRHGDAAAVVEARQGEGSPQGEEKSSAGVGSGSSAKLKKKKKSRKDSSPEEDARAGDAGSPATAVASPSAKTSRKKRKSDSLGSGSGSEEKAAANGSANRGADAGANGNCDGTDGPGDSPPSTGKHRKKKKRRDSGESAAEGEASRLDTALETAAAPTEAAEDSSPAVSSPSAKKKKKGKGKKGDEAAVAGGEDEAVEPPKTESSPGSSEKKKKKKKEKRGSSPGDDPPTSPVENASEMPPPPAQVPLSFSTPPKRKGGAASGKKCPGTSESSRKTVRFGVNMAKDHTASVKDLKTRVITPSKDSGTPQKGLLKVRGGSALKPKAAAGRKGTPHHRAKRASDFF